MIRMLLALLAVLCIAAPAQAQEEPYIFAPDDEYLESWFGTEMIVFSTTSLAEEGWIGDILPDEFSYDTSYLIGLVNALRIQQEYEPLLDPDTYFYFDYEVETDGGYESRLNFPGLRPSEVMLLFKSYGGTAEFFGEGQISYMPLLTRDFYAYNENAMAPLALDISGETVVIQPGATIDDIEKLVVAGFQVRYGQDVQLSVYYNISSYADGFSSATVSVTAELPAG